MAFSEDEMRNHMFLTHHESAKVRDPINTENRWWSHFLGWQVREEEGCYSQYDCDICRLTYVDHLSSFVLYIYVKNFNERRM